MNNDSTIQYMLNYNFYNIKKDIMIAILKKTKPKMGKLDKQKVGNKEAKNGELKKGQNGN